MLFPAIVRLQKRDDILRKNRHAANSHETVGHPHAHITTHLLPSPPPPPSVTAACGSFPDSQGSIRISNSLRFVEEELLVSIICKLITLRIHLWRQTNDMSKQHKHKAIIACSIPLHAFEDLNNLLYSVGSCTLLLSFFVQSLGETKQSSMRRIRCII